MYKKMNFISKTLVTGLCVILAGSFSSCGDIDDSIPKKNEVGSFFISVTGEFSEYIMQASSLETGDLVITDNVKQLELSGYTWIFNEERGNAIGLIYRQGDPGVGLGYGVTAEGTFVELGQFEIATRFTSYGFFDKYAITSVGGQTPANDNSRSDGVTFNFIDMDNNLARTDKTITTLNMTGNGEQATFSGFVDMGNGEFLTSLVMSQPRDPNATGGASTGTVTYPDSVWVAAYDANLNLKRIYRDNRISYSSGRFRSQYYSQIAKGGDGNVYVFSGSYETSTTKPCGALRIKAGGTDFDKSYYFNIEKYSEGYHFRKVWHITGDYFLLEFYNDLAVSPTGAATRYGIVNVADNAQSFKWVTGIPAKDKITGTGLPTAYNGKMYFPITAESANPAIYIIDPVTASATKGISVAGAKSINSVGRLTNK
jgi:hypothetical protein